MFEKKNTEKTMSKKIKHRFPIAQKIGVFIVISSLIAGVVGLALAYWNGYNILHKTIVRDYYTMTKLLNGALSRIISREIKSAAVFMNSSDRLKRVEACNLRYAGMSEAQRVEFFKDIDQRWSQAADNDPLVAEYTQSAVGKRLAEIVADDPGTTEIFMTDKYGGLALASDRTTDFYQADEQWWQKSFDHGKGKIYLESVGYDSSSKSLGMAVVVPVRNKRKELIGIYKATLEVNHLFRPFQNFAIGKSGHVSIIDKNGYYIFHPGILSMSEKIPDATLKKIIGQNSGYLVQADSNDLHKEKVIITFFKIDQPELIDSGVEWWICITEKESEAFALLKDLLFSFIIVALIMFGMVLLVGFVFSFFLVQPIIKLRDAVKKVAQGDLEYKVEVKASDEIGDLSDSFNEMLVNLKHNFTTIDKLSEEINLRKRLQEELFFEKENLEATLLCIGDGVIATDNHGKVTLINREAQTLTGYASFEAVGKPAIEVFKIINEKTRKPCENPFEKILTTGKAIALGNHTALIAKDGREIIIADSGVPIFDTAGKIMGAVLVFRDITELTRAEHALRTSELKVRTMVNNVPGAIYRCLNDTNWTMEFISQEIFNITGYAAESFIGNKERSYASIILEEDNEKISRIIQKAVDSHGQYTLEYRIRCADNSIKWVYEKGQGLYDDDGKLLTLDGAIFDVDEHKKKEIRLVALNRAVEQSPACIVITDLKGDIQYVNPKFIQLTGYSLEEAIGKNPRILKSGEQPVEFYKQLWETIFSGKEWQGEFHNKKKNGEFYWEFASISPLRNQAGEITNFIAVKEDITLVKKYQHDLENKNKELEKLDQLKSDFVSVVSHELRTPLAITKEGISLILDGVTGEINPKQNKILTTSKNNIDRLARIINSLLDISKIESGRVELKKSYVNLVVLIENVIASFAPKAKEKSIELKVGPHEDKEMSLYVDEDRIIQVFTNLIGNALKFTEKGSITISWAQKQDEVEFTVADTGVGIYPNDLPNVFTKFMQFGRTAGAGEKGTGLGLSIAKALVELHRGRIWVESQVDVGSKFIFLLPSYSTNQVGRDQIEDAIAYALRSSAHFSLIVIIVKYSDKIKSGAQAVSLVEAERVIVNELHKGRDFVWRQGNQLLVILQDCNKSCSEIVQARIMKLIKDYFSSINLGVDVKIDLGCVTYPDEANNYQELIDKAKPD